MGASGHGFRRWRPDQREPLQAPSDPDTRDCYRIGGGGMQPSPAAQLAMA